VRHCSRIITNSRCSSVPFESLADVELIYDGVAPQRGCVGKISPADIRLAWGVADSDLLVIALGTYSEAKGHGMLLRAAPRILASSPNAKLIFVGGEPRIHPRWRSAMSRRFRRRITDHPFQIARQLGIESAVRFAGWAKDIESVIETADVVAFPSQIYEGFGRPLAEAGLFGRPVVAFNLGAAPEIVADGHTGLISQSLTTDSLADSVIQLLQSQKMRTDFGNAGRIRIRQEFSMEQYLSRVTGVLLEQVGQMRRPMRIPICELVLAGRRGAVCGPS
jgi:glycosyltransferase involved in cell wall biosynthesis